jgi:hypothetical protein
MAACYPLPGSPCAAVSFKRDFSEAARHPLCVKTIQLVFLAAVIVIVTAWTVHVRHAHRSMRVMERMLAERDEAWQRCMRQTGQGKGAGFEFAAKDYVDALHEIDSDYAKPDFQLAWFHYVQSWEPKAEHNYILRTKPPQPPPTDEEWEKVVSAATACGITPTTQ